jgi:1,4-dihydroxy-6-naphthoate synthase
MAFVRSHAREMDDSVMRKHIGLYVTDFTIDLGKQGKDAIQKMIEWNDRLTSEK